MLLFIAIATPIAVLFRAWGSETARSWEIASFVVLAVTGASLIFFSHDAGYIGAGAWFALLFIPSIGLKRVAELSSWHRYSDARRLTTLLRFVHPGRELRAQEAFFRDLEGRQAKGQLPAPSPESYQRRRRFRLADYWAVITVILINAIFFAIEGNGSTNPAVLQRLGALDTRLVISGHEYWRLGTSLFLHYGYAHLLFNLLALLILGPGFERAVGGIRFLFCYLVSGLGSTVGVVILTVLHRIQPAQLVGASGCVMGVVGAFAGFLLRDRHVPETRARLNYIYLIVGFQLVFDLLTVSRVLPVPVSMPAHLCGLATGFVLGLFL